MNLREALTEAGRNLTGRSATPLLDAEVLLGFVLSLSKAGLIARSKEEVPAEKLERFMLLVQRRFKQEPLHYITGTREFYGRLFEVSPDVLIPRPETEHLVEYTLTQSFNYEKPIRILDLGTGSGCIAITVAAELSVAGKQCSVVATDLSGKALLIAKNNAGTHNVDTVIEFRQGSWIRALKTGERFDLVISNPPYIVPGDLEVSAELAFEPPSALYAAPDGLEAYRQIAEGISEFINPAAFALAVEIGTTQAEAVLNIFNSKVVSQKSGIIKDLAGHPRICFLQS